MNVMFQFDISALVEALCGVNNTIVSIKTLVMPLQRTVLFDQQNKFEVS